MMQSDSSQATSAWLVMDPWNMSRIAKAMPPAIDDHEIDAIPVGDGTNDHASPRISCTMGIFGLRYAINERGLSDIRTTDHGNERKTHENLFT